MQYCALKHLPLAFMQRYYDSTAERTGTWVIEENEVLLGGSTLTV
jgi:hypothetical protein